MAKQNSGFASEPSRSLSKTPTLPRQVGILRKIPRNSAVFLLTASSRVCMNEDCILELIAASLLGQA
jgi:hypothetical protein